MSVVPMNQQVQDRALLNTSEGSPSSTRLSSLKGNQWRDQVPLPSTQGGVEVEDSCPKSFAKKQTVRQANFQPQLRHDHHRRSGQSYATSSHNLLRRALPGISGCKLQH